MSARDQERPCTGRMESAISEIRVKERGQNQMKHCFVRLTAVIALGAACLVASPAALHAAASPKRPNVVVILVDDMGYGDIAAHGNRVIRTPQLDRLHAESVRLTDFHVDPTCSPTRAALMTGRYSHHVKVWHTIAEGNHLRASELTMADAFRANGYRTGMFGKWHLGSNLPYRPIDRGFDEWLGQGDGGTGTTDDHFLNDRVNDHFLHNGEWQQRNGWAEEVFFDSAMDFIRSSQKAEKPFFIYLCTYSPHHPITLADPASADAYAKAEAHDRTLFVERQRTFKPEKWRGAVGMTSRWRLVDNTELYDIKADPGQTNNVIADHPDVVATLCREFESYWAQVAPGDRDRAEFMVGDDCDPETFLHASDWYLPNPP